MTGDAPSGRETGAPIRMKGLGPCQSGLVDSGGTRMEGSGSVRHPGRNRDLDPQALAWRNANSGAGPERRLT